MATPKYRPSLSLAQIEHLASLCESSPSNPLSASSLRILRTLLIKANAGITPPAFVASQRKTIDDSLGFSESTESKEEDAELWELHKNGAPLNETQKESALSFAYTNDLLSPEQENAYEKKYFS